MIYHLWENTYRPQFEKELDKIIQSDIFGDLAQLRHMILKHEGILNKDAHKKLKLIKYYNSGDRILIDSKKLSEIIKLIEIEVGVIKKS